MRGTLRSIEGDPTQYIFNYLKYSMKIQFCRGVGFGPATGFGDCCLDSEDCNKQNTFWKRTRVECCIERIFPERNSSALPVLYYLEQNFKRWSGKKVLISDHSSISLNVSLYRYQDQNTNGRITAHILVIINNQCL